MELQNTLMQLFESGITPAVLVGALFWNADKIFLSSSGAKVIYRAIESTAKSPERSEVSNYIKTFLDAYFSLENGFGIFLKNVLLLTLVSLSLMLSIYTVKTDGLYEQLLDKGFLTQFLGNGLVVTFLVNFFIFSYYPVQLRKTEICSISKSILFLISDIMAKIILFTLLTILTYVFLASFYGSFSGDQFAAIRAVPPTLLQAIKFGNLTSVYLYSVVISSFPIFVVILINMMSSHPGFSKFIRGVLFFLPFESKPIRAVSSIFAIFSGLFTLIASVFLSLFGS